jgi:hypothetical protein
MNLILLGVGLRVWQGPPLRAVSSLLAAVAILTLEMQVVTWLGIGSLRQLVVLNAVAAVVALLWWRPRWGLNDAPPSAGVPWLAVTALGLLALVLNLTRPIEGADPYHLQRVAQIERLGTLAYDPQAEIKVNALATVYELALADLNQVPGLGPNLVRLHGVLGLLLYALCVAAIRQWLRGGSPWCWAALFALPVLFHQVVLVKNDLFSAIPGMLVLVWLVVRAADAPRSEVAWASSLAGFATAMKMASFPLAIVTVGVVLLRRDRRAIAPWMIAGGLAGGVAGALPFNLVETARTYGHPWAPLADLGNRNETAAAAATSVARFGISLFDLGVLTRRWWPNRGGWGSTFGLPFVWALAVLGLRARDEAAARRALVIGAVYFAAFAIVYPDADLAHRMALAPAIVLIATAVHLTGGGSAHSVWLRRGLVVALVVSVAQIARSFAIYLMQSPVQG